MTFDEACFELETQGEWSLSGKALTALNIVLRKARAKSAIRAEHGLVSFPTKTGHTHGELRYSFEHKGKRYYVIMFLLNDHGQWSSVCLERDQFIDLTPTP